MTFNLTPEHELTPEELKNLRVFPSEIENQANDWIPVWLPERKSMKYGKLMFSNKTQRLRKCNLPEFYNGGTVD